MKHAVFTLALFAAGAAHARTLTITPADPVALEPVVLRTSLIADCEQVSSVEPTAGGFVVRINRVHLGVRCDAVVPVEITLGAFAPGNYRVTTILQGSDFSPPIVEPDSVSFAVAAGPTPTVSNVDMPEADLSGVWVSPAEPYTGFAFIHSTERSDAPSGRTNRVTAIWYDFSPQGQPTWSMLLLDGSAYRLSGQVVRIVPTGSGAARSIALAPAGSATLARDASGNWRLQGTIDAREYDIPLQRFRWTRAAWPGRGPTPQ